MAHLQEARDQGDCLLVLLNDDASVRRRKGQDRPVVPQRERRDILLALRCVDHVVICDAEEQPDMIALWRPAVFAVGSDYSIEQVVGRELVESWGGRVVITGSDRTISTSGRIEACRKNSFATSGAGCGSAPGNTGSRIGTSSPK